MASVTLVRRLQDIRTFSQRVGGRLFTQSYHAKAEAMTRDQRGFSLIELLIVVAIILIIAAIAIPNLLRARIAANEASAVGSIRTINTSSVEYAATYENGFPAGLSKMGTAA